MILAKLVLPPVVTTNNCREYRNYQARRRVLRPAVSVANYDDYYDDYDSKKRRTEDRRGRY